MQISGRRRRSLAGSREYQNRCLILARERCRVKSGMLWSPAMTGQFITFEGLDGSGKSTHLKRAAEWLTGQGVPCQVTHEPGGTPLGDALRGLFLDPRWGTIDGVVELLLVFASRRQHLLEVIEPALAAGRHVLCDRFTDSTYAYQGHGRGVPLPLIAQVDVLATGGRGPDHTLFFDLPAEEARQRGLSPRRQGKGDLDRLDAEDLAFYRRVREGFLARAESDPDRFHRIDSAGSSTATFAQVQRVLQDLLLTEVPV
jgi:dTMP kinase